MKKLERKIFVVLVALFLALASSSVFGQDEATTVIRDFRSRIGNEADIARVRNIYALADCTGPNGPYRTEISSATNGRTIFRQIRKDKPDYIGHTNDGAAWTKGTDIAIANKNAAFAWRSHEFHWIVIQVLDRFRSPRFVAYESFSNKNAVKLSALDELGIPAHLFFDRDSKLLLGFTIQDPFSKTPQIIRLTFNEWKKVGKLLLPSKVTATDKQGDFVLNFHTIKVNQLNEKVFEVPRGIAAVNELLKLHEQQRSAHFERDANLLVSMFDDNFIEVRNGRVTMLKKEDALNRFRAYFEASSFIEWDDIAPPIVRVSDDATLAYLVINKRVRIKTKDAKETADIFAWTSTFQKINGK